MFKNRENYYIKRPLMVGVLFFILGLIGGELHYNQMQLSLFFMVVIMISTGMVFIYKNIYLFLYLLCTALGMIGIIFNPILKDEANLIHQEKISLTGQVLHVKEYQYQTQYIIKPDQKSNLKAKVKVEVKKGLKVAKQGDYLVVSGHPMALTVPRNPGAFDERTYLLIRGVASKLKADSFQITKEARDLPIFCQMRAYYGAMFDRALPFQEAQIMKAMLLGDKTFLSKDIQDLYKEAGIAHVLAISGLHISIMAGVLWWLLRKITRNRYLQSICLLLILWSYGALTGFSISITRSIIMMSVMIIGTLIDEKPDPITYLSFAALILLLYNNLYLWDIGFQLSFVAVGSMILLSRFFGRIFTIPKQIRDYISPIIAVSLGTTPLVAYYFYVISPIGILTNMVLVPLITLVVILGFIAIVIYPVSGFLSKLMLGSGYYLLVSIEKLSKLALKLPCSTLVVGRPTCLEFLIYFLGLGLVIYYLSLSLEERNNKKKKIMIGSISLLSLFFLGQVWPGDLEVTFLDVGQGDSMIIRTPDHKTFVIDGGLAGKGKILEGFLKHEGIRKVDGAILSHAHLDHMGGLGDLASTYQIDSLFLSELPLADVHFKNFYDIIKSKDIPIYKIRAGHIIKGKDYMIECIFPYRDLPPLEGNDASLVLVLKHGQVSYYFTGDIEENYERGLADQVEKNRVNILKVAHHGSSTSSTFEFITQVDPDLAIISCGENNLYNHPSKEVINRYKENKTPVKITKDGGAVMTYSNKKNVKVYQMEDKRVLWK